MTNVANTAATAPRNAVVTSLGPVSMTIQNARLPACAARQYMHNCFLTKMTASRVTDISTPKRTIQRNAGVTFGDVEKAYIARTTGRGGYKRAMDACPATKAWVASLSR